MVRKKDPSPRQQRILEFIRNFFDENGRPPTVRDIQTACDISSTSVVDYNLRLLERDGHLTRKPDIARGIELPNYHPQPRTAPELIRAPVLGVITAGQPAPVMDTDAWTDSESQETLELTQDVLRVKAQVYALRVRGTSMIDALVDDGDLVLIEPVKQANNGDMVVARLRMENETTLKRLYVEGDRVRLQPANSQMEPIYSQAENVEVQGRVVGVIRALV